MRAMCLFFFKTEPVFHIADVSENWYSRTYNQSHKLKIVHMLQ